MTKSKQANHDTVNLTLLYHEQVNSTLVEDLEKYYQQYNEIHQYKYMIHGKEHCWIVHKPILSQHSPYFAAMFDHEFYESTASIICLPSSILNYYGMNAVIHYMYHSRDFKYWLDRNYHEAGDKLFLLQDTYATADYFGMSDLCIHIIECLNDLVHQWNCHCDDCVYIIPQLYEYTYLNTLYQKQQQQQSSSSYQKQNQKNNNDQQNHEILLNKICSKAIHCLTHDPEKCLPNFWTHRNMARMLDELSNDNNLMFSRRICKRITKCNAIESLHACFLATTTLANTDPLLCWSRSLHATLASVQAKSTQLIAKHFNYYCSQYPTLLSCIDGITYSFDFLEYLFMHVLEDQMDTFNAGILYQGIVRDLLCRHSVQYNDQVKHILNVAKDIILQYISNRIDLMKKMAALDNLDTEVLKTLANELDVPIKSLIKSMSKHRGLSQPNLLSILFPPPKISYPNSSASSLHLSRRSSLTTQRTYSLQSNSASIYSARYYNSNNNNNSHSSSIIKILKGWIGAGDYKQNHHASTSLSSSSISNPSPVSSSSTPDNENHRNHIKQNKTQPHHPYHKTTIFSWATVTVKFPKKNHGTLYRFFFQHSKLSSQARQKSKMLVVGKRVQLTRRPVLTVGTVKYVGPVLFAEGTWVGVELDRRVGKNDGSVDGERYFTTSPNRGVFVRSDDLKVMF
ncbi:unnamed protein product [Cunninghamella blakesleeana]